MILIICVLDQRQYLEAAIWISSHLARLSCLYLFTTAMKVQPQAPLPPIHALQPYITSRAVAARLFRTLTVQTAARLRNRNYICCSYLRSLYRCLAYPLHYRLKRFPNLFRHSYFPHTVKRIKDTEVSAMTTIDFQIKSLAKEVARSSCSASIVPDLLLQLQERFWKVSLTMCSTQSSPSWTVWHI